MLVQKKVRFPLILNHEGDTQFIICLSLSIHSVHPEDICNMKTFVKYPLNDIQPRVMFLTPS